MVPIPPPSQKPTISMYCCGPTVYDYTHVGHIRKYLMDDIIIRTLIYMGYEVEHVMNVTDVGHLTDDADTGEDKLEKGAAKTGKTVWDVAAMYTQYFERTMNRMGISLPDGKRFCRATDHIAEMIALIQQLEERGFTYETDQAIYYDVAQFEQYGSLSGQSLKEKQTAVREEVNQDDQKRCPADFALWFKRTGRFANHTMHWESPWGDGFPGWHIECSAMSMAFLGKTIDIHTGGIDHIPVHHENEIAQSEAATGIHPFVRIWVHHHFLMVEGQKMSKSLGNYLTLDQIEEQGISPMALRLLFLQTHYRQEMNFTWEAAHGAQESWQRLLRRFSEIVSTNDNPVVDRSQLSEEAATVLAQFTALVSGEASDQDLQIPQAVALLWQIIRSTTLSAADKQYLVEQFDLVFGLSIADAARDQATHTNEIPDKIREHAQQRQQAREAKDWATADRLREEITAAGYTVEDTADGPVVTKQSTHTPDG